jgi:hypothetical protein
MAAPRKSFAWVEHPLTILAGYLIVGAILWARVEGLLP